MATGCGCRYPRIRRLFMSGYTADVLSSHGVNQADVPFLQKPFANAELVARVSAQLDGPPAVAE